MARIDIEVEHRSVEKTTERVSSAVEDALDDAMGDVLDEAVDRGKDHITKEEAIWRSEVLGKTMHADFDWTELSKSEAYTIYNSAMHAGIVDEGTQFDSHPRASSLIEWVRDNLDDWDPFEDKDDGDEGGGGGGGLASIANNISDNETEETDSADIDGIARSVGERFIYDDSVFSVYRNKRLGNPSPYSYELSETVGYQRSKQTDLLFADSSFPALPADEEEKLLTGLKSEYGSDAVDRVTGSIDTWKETGFSDDAQFIEKLAKGNYDIEARLRGEDALDSSDPSQTELDVYHELAVASQEFLSRNVADDNGNLQLYRGMNTIQTGTLGEEIFNNPDGSRWGYEDSVVQNYSTVQEVVDQFSKGIEVSATANVRDNTLLSPDFILDDTLSAKRNAEVHLIGGQRHFGRDKVSFSGVDAETILEGDLNQFGDKEHGALKEVVDLLYEQDKKITNDKGIQRLNEWQIVYNEYIGDDPDLAEKVHDITGNYDGVDYSDEIDTFTDANGSLDSDTSTTDIIRGNVDYSGVERQSSTKDSNFPRLSVSEVTDLENTLKGEYSTSSFKTTAELVEDWKFGPSSKTVAELENLVKQTHDIDAPVRFGDQYSLEDPTDEEIAVFNELTQASHDFIEESAGDRRGNVKLHRGLGETETAQLGKTILENQDNDDWTLDSSVIMGFSFGSDVADYHSEGLELHITADADRDVVLADDSLFASEYLPFYDGEVFITGGSRSYDRSSVSINGVNATDIMDKEVTDWSQEELVAMLNMLRSMEAKGVTVTKADAKQILRDWEDRYQVDVDTGDGVQELVESIIE